MPCYGEGRRLLGGIWKFVPKGRPGKIPSGSIPVVFSLKEVKAAILLPQLARRPCLLDSDANELGVRVKIRRIARRLLALAASFPDSARRRSMSIALRRTG
jgi:hypothetical protein